MLKNIELVLVDPVYPGNVGALARSASNFGVQTIKIVGSLKFLCLESKKMALYGYPLLEQAEQYETLEDALKPCSLVIGTVHQTRRQRTRPRASWKTVELVADRLTSERTAFVFGREDNGLTREEVDQCHLLTTIPTPGNTSFNLAHSVTVFLYEIYRTIYSREKKQLPRRPEQAEFEECFSLLDQTLTNSGFLRGDQSGSVMTQIRDIAFRSSLFAQDLPLIKAILYRMLKLANS